MLTKISQHPVKAICFILFLTLLAFSNIFPNQFVMDDFAFIVDWPLIRDLSNIPQFFVGYTPPPGQDGIYSPLKTLIHAINYHMFGLNVFGHHIFSLIVHALGILYAYKICFLLTNSREITFIAALLFALHPVHVEPITAFTGSVDTAGVVMLMASFFYYVRFLKAGGEKRSRLYILSVILGILSVFTHELNISLPLLLLWYEVLYSFPEDSWKKIAKRVGPFFIMVGVYVVCKFLVLDGITRGEYIYGSFYLTMLVIIKAFAKYVCISFFPLTLTHNHIISKGIYSFDQADFDKFAVLSQSFFDVPILLSLLLVGGVIFFAFVQYTKNRLVTFSIGFFFISLLPVANIIPSGVYFAERYMYHGLLGFCLIVSIGLNRMLAQKNWQRAVAGIVLCALVLFYMGRVWIRNKDWKDEIALYESTVKANPESALMRTDMGIIYSKYGEHEKAVKSFQQSLMIRPEDPVTFFALANAHLELQEYNLAIAALKEAIQLKPDYPEAHYNLAGVYAFWGMRSEALEHLEKAVHFYEQQGRTKEAAEQKKVFLQYFQHKLRK